MKPSDRIFEIAKQVAAQRQDEAKKHPNYDFLAKVSGMTEAEQIESLEREPRTLIAAIFTYLDEQAAK